ncbi:MAG: type II secretion system protein GspD [Candidatus Riflebacteria bacterium]|nr:type II secretion system protein GspD [Candidatus Riflebacteria bacterium]
MFFPRKTALTAVLIAALLVGYGRSSDVEAGQRKRIIRIINPSIKQETSSPGLVKPLPTVKNPVWEASRKPSRRLDGFDSSPFLKKVEFPKLKENESAVFISELADVAYNPPSSLMADRVMNEATSLFKKPESAPAVPEAIPPQKKSQGDSAPSPVTGALPLTLLSPEPPKKTEIAEAEVVEEDIGQTSTSKTFKLPSEMNIKLKSLDFRDTEVKDALRGLANLISLNLIIESNVAGNITILFSEISLEDAFRTIMKSLKLVYVWEGSILRIFRAEDAPLVTKIFNIQNANAQKVKEIIDKMLTPSRGSAEFDSRTNSVMVKDTPEVIESIMDVLPRIDIRESVVDVQSRPVTEVFYLDYVDAANLSEPIKMIAPEAKIQAYSSTQASQAGASSGGGTGRQDMMIITDTQNSLEKIRELIGKLDVSPTQVIIDAHIYEIDLNEEERLGINWQKQIPIAGTTENLFDMSISPEDANAGGTGVFRFGTLGVNQFRALLAMLQTKSFAKVLSNPVITTLNNKPANITVGQAIPYISGSTTDVNGQVTSQVAQVNANITLDVTPSVTGNDEVFLDIKPQITSILGFTTLSGNSTPNLSQRSAQTQVIVRNNHTIVIGGMIKTDKSDTLTKVPYLGDIPGLGKLFRKKTVKETRTELIIFITPHIIRNTKTNNFTKEMLDKKSFADNKPKNEAKPEAKKKLIY